MTVTRFAPSPTGNLHLGHAYSALYSERVAREEGGKFLLRIEDIDGTRCRSEYIQNIYDDIEWLGVVWDDEVIVQSNRLKFYVTKAEILEQRGLLYPCFCTRKELANINGKGLNREKGLYPKTCLRLTNEQVAEKKSQGVPFSLRLNSNKAKKKPEKFFGMIKRLVVMKLIMTLWVMLCLFEKISEQVTIWLLQLMMIFKM